MKRPSSIKAIFLMTVFKICLSFVFFAVFTLKGVNADKTQLILFTALSYVVIAVPTMVFIHRRNAMAVRFCLVAAVAASIPAPSSVSRSTSWHSF